MDQAKLLERIKSKVKTMENGCIEWTGSFKSANHGKSLYGQCRYNGKTYGTHRLFYELSNGPIPKHLEIDHICRNSKCVNVEHLRAVDHKTNMNNTRKSDRTACPHNHPLLGDNLYISPHGRRICRICRDSSAITWRRNNPQRYLDISRKSYYKLRMSSLESNVLSRLSSDGIMGEDASPIKGHD